MKNIITLSFFLLFVTTLSFSQTETCDCKKDLDFVVAKMEKMPSYKKQIRGKKKSEFEVSYKLLSSKMEEPISIENCFKLLLEQMLLVNDSHTSLSINSEFLSENNLENNNYKTTNIYKNHPKTKRNLNQLTEELSAKPISDLEGIYNYTDDQKIGIYYAENSKDLIGVVLKNKLEHWDIGDISFYAYYRGGKKYNVYNYKLSNKTPRFVKSLTFENGRIWNYKKIGNNNNFELPEKEQPELEFKQIKEDIQYLYFGNFSNGKKKALNTFFNDTKNKLTAKNIIVDLRSNSGGNKKFSDPYLKLLKNKNLYIITNCFTGSNGEQFTVKLKEFKNSKHLGQSTFGVIAYGINYGRTYDTPSGFFEIKPTDMNFHEFYKYENKGVTPDITLDFDRDWIEQTSEIIEKDTI